jgi:hypothetical protein
MERMNGGEIVEHMFIYMFFFFITGWRVQNESDLLWSLPIHTPREVCYRHASDSLSELFSSQFLFVLIAVCFVIAAYGTEFLKANGEHAAGYLEKSSQHEWGASRGRSGCIPLLSYKCSQVWFVFSNNMDCHWCSL